MGRSARSVRFFSLFAAALWASTAIHAHAAATATFVALNSASSCSSGRIDVRLKTSSASTESGLATSVSGQLNSFQNTPTLLSSVDNTSPAAPLAFFFFPYSPQQGPNTRIGLYAYVGETVPDASNTAEFFVYYNCSTQQVLYSCFGPYGTCPQTAAQAQLLVAQIPALSPALLVLSALLIAGVGALALRRHV